MSIDINDIKVGDKLRLRSDMQHPSWARKYQGLIGTIGEIWSMSSTDMHTVGIRFTKNDGTQTLQIPCYLWRLEYVAQPYTVDEWSID